MRILTLDNKCYKLEHLPDELTDDIRFSVLDNSNPKEPDFFYIPLIFLESFNSPAMVMEIGGREITMPIDWHLAVGDSGGAGDIEVLPLTSLNDRGFEAFLFNPLTSTMMNWGEVKITNFYNDVKWYFPKMKNGKLLGVPLTDGDNPQCAWFVKDISRQSEVIDYGILI